MPQSIPVNLVKNFKKHELVLKALKNSKTRKSKLIIDNAPSTLFNLIKSICKYVLTGKLRLNKNHVKKLKKHKQLIRNISRGDHKTVKRHIQKGSGIKNILTTILPILTSIIPAIV